MIQSAKASAVREAVGQLVMTYHKWLTSTCLSFQTVETAEPKTLQGADVRVPCPAESESHLHANISHNVRESACDNHCGPSKFEYRRLDDCQRKAVSRFALPHALQIC